MTDLTEDLAIRDATIITLNPANPRAEALAIRGGRIAAIGSWSDVSDRAKGVPVLDLNGRTVVPGLIDTHAHFLWTALSLAATDVADARDHDALKRILEPVVASTPKDDVVFGMGFTEYPLDTETFSPIIDALDAVAPDQPVFLSGVTGHTSAVNTSALNLLELPEGTPGVKRDSAERPNGLLADEANSMALKVFSRLFGAEDRAAEMLAQAVNKAHSVGITTLHALEGGPIGDNAGAEHFLAAIPSLPLRIVFYYQTTDVDRARALGLPRIGGCILLDGDVGPRTAALSEPYVDDPKCYGTLYFTQEEIDAFVLEAHSAGLQVAMHAVGDAAVEQALNAYEAALEMEPRSDHRHRIEHCEVIREEQIERARRLGVALAIQPPFNHYWDHTTYIPSIGEERASRVDPVATLMRPGLLVAGGSDSTVTPLGPLIGVHAAVNHSLPRECVTVQQALELYTVNAARIAFEEAEKGSLEVGKLGDLVVLGEDPFEVDSNRILEIPVEMTVIGGQVVYRREPQGSSSTQEQKEAAGAREC
ncbi:MAG: amidohydrolase [Anaerolineae bacterium]|jgi:predicted amidohydrolase YtcJ